MKAKITILVIIGVLISSCIPKAAAQEIGVATEIPFTKTPVVPEPVVTEVLIATELPTEVPTKSSMACVTLLTPENGADLPAIGKVTFSWTPLNEAGNYVLNFILPTGGTVFFETDQTLRDRYMEAFGSGGQYQWQVSAQDIDGKEICVSEIATFVKPAYEKPNDGNNGNDKNGNGSGDDGSSNNCDPIAGCDGEH